MPKLIFACLIVVLLSGSLCHRVLAETLHEPALAVSNINVNISALSTNELRAIFSLRVRNWPNGQPIRVIVRSEKDPDTLLFLREVLKMLPHQLRRQWDRIIYSGLGQGPLFVNSQEEMLEHVANTPGAIGFIRGGTAHENVQVLAIE